MKCPFCGSRSRVIDVRPRSNSLVKRRHECKNKNCRQRFTSWQEVDKEDNSTTTRSVARA